nr:ribonuclease H-like domain-containing protein [Tanacetum cinerariifolium]
AEAVNTACYVLNRALVIKPHNKTPYELIRRRSTLIDFMKPFGCPVTILNTRDSLGKFDEKVDEGFFVGYSVVSQAEKKKEPEQEYILIPICTTDPLISQGPKDSAVDAGNTNTFEEHSFERFSPFKNAFSLPYVPIMSLINGTGIFGNAYDDEAVEEEVDMNNVVSS